MTKLGVNGNSYVPESEREECAVCSEVRAARPRGFAIYTMNSVYVIDADSVCIGVIHRRTGRRRPRHHLVGYTLTGARRDIDGGHEIQTLPEVGWQATFQKLGDEPRAWADPRLIITSCVQAITPL